MNSEAHQKVHSEHLQRTAFLYVRQSSVRQVRENTESTKRQYDLRDRALALGWSADQITVIDCDQGQSGSSAIEREGFQKLVTEVSMNRAGIVMGLEVSRLARNCADWHTGSTQLHVLMTAEVIPSPHRPRVFSGRLTKGQLIRLIFWKPL